MPEAGAGPSGPGRRPWGAGRILLLRGLGPARRSWERLDARGALRLALFGGLALGFEAALFGIFRVLALGLWSQPLLGPLLGARVLELGFDLLFALMLLTALPAFLGRLLRAEDAPLFAASPMDPADYFSLRLAEAGLGAAWILPLFWIPGALALRRALGAGWAFVPWALLAPLPLAVLACALGAGCVCLLLRVLPPQRLRRWLTACAGAGFAAFLVLLLRLHPERLSDPQAARSIGAYLAGLGVLDAAWLPGTWPCRAVLEGRGAPWRAAGIFGAGALLAWAAWAGVVRLFGSDAFGFWLKGQDAPERGARRRGRAFQGRGSPTGFLFRQGAVSLVRAPGQGAQALLLAGLLALFSVSLGRLPLGRDQQLKDWLFLPACGAGQALLVAVAARFVYPAPSLDFGARWLLLQAPPLPREHLRARALLAAALLLPLAVFLAWDVDRVLTPSPALAAASWGCFLGLSLSLACLSAGLGTAWAKAADHAEEALASASGVLAVVLGLGLVLGTNAFLAPLLRFEAARRWRPGGSPLPPTATLGLAVVLNAGAAAWAWRAGLKRLGEGD